MTNLWPHQTRAVQMLAKQDATLLFWGMGAGKTLPVVTHIAEQKPQRTLILCPRRVVGVWPSEFKKHAPTTNVNIAAPEKGSAKKRWAHIASALDTTPTVAVLNYEAARAPSIKDHVLATPWDLVVCDEIHRIKAAGGSTSRFVNLLRVRGERRGGVKRVGLTGTLMPHSPIDVYAQYRFLEPAIFGTSKAAFMARYAVMGGFQKAGRPVEVVAWQRQAEMASKIDRIADRIRREDVLDLPDAIHVERKFDLPPKARRLYQEIEQNLIAQVKDGTIRTANAMTKVTMLQEIASGFAYTEEGGTARAHDEKSAELADVLEDLHASDHVVVFCKFRPCLDDAVACVRDKGRPVVQMRGGLDEIGSRWEPTAPGEVAVVQIQSGAEGVDFTAAATCVYWDQTFSLGTYDQSLARIHRPGQKRRCTYIHLLARGTVDVAIRRALDKRRDAVEAIVNEMKGNNERQTETSY